MPRSAYIHVPFCARRCGYCNFSVVAGRDDLVESFLKALELELQALEQPRPVDTLYIGGGTPTHLAASDLEPLLSTVLRWFPCSPNAEFAVEANPLDLSPVKAEVLKDHGVNRISLGVQSFEDAKLIALERNHNGRAAHEAVAIAQAHFPQVSVDLIFAAPGETLAMWQKDLHAVTAADVSHVSAYGLTYDKGAAFYGRKLRGKLTETGEGLQRDMFEMAIDQLATAGHEHYEVSNYAWPGHRSRHNQVYWRCEEYFAAGPGAARYINGVRSTNHGSTTTYMKRLFAGKSPVAECERIDVELAARERLVFGLRMLEGINLSQFRRQCGYSVRALAGPAIDEFIDRGLLLYEAENDHKRCRLRLSHEGLMVSDSIFGHLL